MCVVCMRVCVCCCCSCCWFNITKPFLFADSSFECVILAQQDQHLNIPDSPQSEKVNLILD